MHSLRERSASPPLIRGIWLPILGSRKSNKHVYLLIRRAIGFYMQCSFARQFIFLPYSLFSLAIYNQRYIFI